MQLPDNYRELPRLELLALAHRMSNWNSGQSWSDKKHREHYEREIHPIHKHLGTN